MWLLLAFLIVPLIEIGLFIQIGGVIGLWSTLLIVVVTAFVGAALVRSQGLAVIERLRRSLADVQDPTEHLAHGAMIVFSGALLLTPGFFTDAVGFALLVPGIRLALIQAVRRRVHVQRFDMGPDQARGRADPASPGTGRATVIEGEFTDVSDTRNKPGKPSGWSEGP